MPPPEALAALSLTVTLVSVTGPPARNKAPAFLLDRLTLSVLFESVSCDEPSLWSAPLSVSKVPVNTRLKPNHDVSLLTVGHTTGKQESSMKIALPREPAKLTVNRVPEPMFSPCTSSAEIAPP